MAQEDKAEEVINELLDRMKSPDVAKKAFEDLAGRVRIMQNLAKK